MIWCSSGKSICESGADVVLLARRKEKLDTVAEGTRSLGRRALPVQCDVTDEENVKKAVQEVIGTFGKIDILLNNAGIAVHGGMHTLTETSQWSDVKVDWR